MEDTIINHSIRKELGLTVNEMVILVELAKNTHSSGSLRDMLGMSRTAIIHIKGKLLFLGLIEVTKRSDKEAYDILNKSNSESGCRFCGLQGHLLDKHHYPVRKKYGGTLTVSLCSNCHRQFHRLTDIGDIKTTIPLDL